MQIKDAISGQVHACRPETDLRSVANMMVEHDCGAIPVVAEGAKARPLGIVTDRDIVARAVAAGGDPRHIQASDAMTTDPVTVSREESVEHAMQLMSDNQVRRLLVVDESDDLAGVFSLADLARARPDRQTAATVENVSQPSDKASGPAPS